MKTLVRFAIIGAVLAITFMVRASSPAPLASFPISAGPCGLAINSQGTAVTPLTCVALFPVNTITGYFPNLRITDTLTQQTAKYTGSVVPDTVTAPNGRNLGTAVIDQSVPAWSTVVDPATGLTSSEVTRLTLYLWGSYAEEYQIQCAGPPTLKGCWVGEVTANFSYRVQVLIGGAREWVRSIDSGEFVITQLN